MALNPISSDERDRAIGDRQREAGLHLDRDDAAIAVGIGQHELGIGPRSHGLEQHVDAGRFRWQVLVVPARDQPGEGCDRIAGLDLARRRSERQKRDAALEACRHGRGKAAAAQRRRNHRAEFCIAERVEAGADQLRIAGRDDDHRVLLHHQDRCRLAIAAEPGDEVLQIAAIAGDQRPGIDRAGELDAAEFDRLVQRRGDQRADEQRGAQRDEHADAQGPAQERMAELDRAVGHPRASRPQDISDRVNVGRRFPAIDPVELPQSEGRRRKPQHEIA